MDFKNFTMRDFHSVRPPEEVVKLSKSDKFKLIDFLLQRPTDATKRGLLVTIDISHGGRRINNRVYPPLGQRDSLASWKEPFPKPLLLNHDTTGDPMGRLVDVRFVLLDEAVKYFRNVDQFMEVRAALETADPKTVYKVLKKYHLHTDSMWPGLSKLQADVKVTNEDAIERFLDGRYLTVSAGTTSDRYACGLCGQDWMVDGPCEHTPGLMTEDGEVGTIVTGKFIARELSIVNVPADSMAFVRNITFSDSVQLPQAILDSSQVSADRYLLTDAQITLPTEVDMMDTNTIDALKAQIFADLKEAVSGELAALRALIEDQAKLQQPPVQAPAPQVVNTPALQVTDEQLAPFVQQLLSLVQTALPAAPPVDDTAEQLQQDLTAALTLVEDTKRALTESEDKLQSLLAKAATIHSQDFSSVEDDKKLDSMYDWFSKMDATKIKTFDATQHHVENPSGGTSSATPNSSASTKKPNTFETSIIDRYNSIKAKSGDAAAEVFLAAQRRYLPADFHPRNFS